MTRDELREHVRALATDVAKGGTITASLVAIARTVLAGLDSDTPEARARESKRLRMQRYRAAHPEKTRRRSVDANVDADPSTQTSTSGPCVDAKPSTQTSTEASTQPSNVDASPSTPLVARAVSRERSLSEISQSSSYLREKEPSDRERARVDAAPSTQASTLKGPRRVEILALRAAEAETLGTEKRNREQARQALVDKLARAERRRDDEERSFEERQRGREDAERAQRELAVFDIQSREMAEARAS